MLGIDISPVVLLSALKVVKDYGLADKTPYIYLVRDADYRFLPGSYFDVVHAHSVFTHLPLTVIGAVMAGVKSILKPGGFFDFTFFSSATQGSFLGEDFFYPEDVLLELAARLGFEAQIMTDWTYPQEKVRASLPRA